MSAEISIDSPSRRPRIKLWPLGSLPLSMSILWAANAGGEALRWLVLGGFASVMMFCLLVSLEAGMIAMMIFEPLRGFLRRAQYLYLTYSQSDPIHIITPIVTLLAFVMILQRHRLRLLYQSTLAGWVSLLAAIYFLQIFNPLQGGLSVGFSGAMFVLIPLLWFYFAQVIKPEFMLTAFRVIVVLGILTSLYGLYQLAFGFPAFEQYWIDNTDFYNSISVGKVERALATFSSAEEWGRYVEIGALIAFGFAAQAMNRMRRAGWIVVGGTLSLMLLFTGQRTAMFGLILGFLVLVLMGARSWRAAMARMFMLLAPALLIGVLAKAPTNDDMLDHGDDERAKALLSHTARGTLNPTKEDSLNERFKNWTFLATDVIPYRPLGLGVGATSIGAWRYGAGDNDLPPIDSYFISSVLTCGVPTVLLLIWILAKATAISWRSYKSAEPGSPEARLWRIAATIMPVLILNNMFGNTFTLYSVAPFGWLLVGWISTWGLARKTDEAGTLELGERELIVI
ncbi:MAG TPA: O-antigen ligase family protein [Pyrinomonadaceae bacterium]|nr:O-antigen ligase family protein [Pyrinomonadaceae bacterium]